MYREDRQGRFFVSTTKSCLLNMGPLKIQEGDQKLFFLSFQWGIHLQGLGAKVVESRKGSRLIGVPMNEV